VPDALAAVGVAGAHGALHLVARDAFLMALDLIGRKFRVPIHAAIEIVSLGHAVAVLDLARQRRPQHLDAYARRHRQERVHDDRYRIGIAELQIDLAVDDGGVEA